MNAPVLPRKAGLGASVLALGRLKTGEMNKTEAAYARHLEGLKAAGEVAWYRFEGLKFRLADGCFYTPDFAVMRGDGAMECHEVKGHWSDDARVKIKVAAEMYPLRFLAIRVLAKKHGGGWEVEDF
ncbi:DUF1064 domain-containing protein [Methylobacterium sp. WL30]|uniref:DUF1064 domain-containing protein n=1 Tax=unclassified Methylobacterium TaxID=2615210 RepID=UPI0011CB8ED2|nr:MULTISPECIES: DUF1064 domain-containing protein [unclassified Methylobacterium]TXN38969.1 DUF1064 domain-containing protein [Methylobacterium sp. WL93]TXN52256.1 DUF1064 domain-containing protein [Methylobacterium sp. WL119]TXN70661.1 DUF1064 domain-containing protein [Methylobacterium sp. WL30]